MRVTMIVRCLAMMRGGGETRHLAWMRQLAAMGVDVDVITGAPWLLGRARHPVTGVASTVLRTPYLRDAVYRWQQTRGFGRATMTALHLDEEWFCRAAWRAIEARPEPPDLVHAHALHQTARLRRVDCPVVINLPGAPHTRSSPTGGRPSIFPHSSGVRSNTSRRASTRIAFRRMAPIAARSSSCRRRASSLPSDGSYRSRTSRCSSKRSPCCGSVCPRRTC
jgi:hypothetical protein